MSLFTFHNVMGRPIGIVDTDMILTAQSNMVMKDDVPSHCVTITFHNKHETHITNVSTESIGHFYEAYVVKDERKTFYFELPDEVPDLKHESKAADSVEVGDSVVELGEVGGVPENYHYSYRLKIFSNNTANLINIGTINAILIRDGNTIVVTEGNKTKTYANSNEIDYISDVLSSDHYGRKYVALTVGENGRLFLALSSIQDMFFEYDGLADTYNTKIRFYGNDQCVEFKHLELNKSDIDDCIMTLSQ